MCARICLYPGGAEKIARGGPMNSDSKQVQNIWGLVRKRCKGKYVCLLYRGGSFSASLPFRPSFLFIFISCPASCVFFFRLADSL